MDGEITVQDVYDSLSTEKKKVLHLLIGLSLRQSFGFPSLAGYPRASETYHFAFTDLEKRVTAYLINEAQKEAYRDRRGTVT